jgi:hypothetical protein
MNGGELLELQLLNTQLVDNFWPFRAVFTFLDNPLDHQRLTGFDQLSLLSSATYKQNKSIFYL